MEVREPGSKRDRTSLILEGVHEIANAIGRMRQGSAGAVAWVTGAGPRLRRRP
jgi:hypothetical protein